MLLSGLLKRTQIIKLHLIPKKACTSPAWGSQNSSGSWLFLTVGTTWVPRCFLLVTFNWRGRECWKEPGWTNMQTDYWFFCISFLCNFPICFNRKVWNWIFENLYFAICDVADWNVLNWEKFWQSFHPLSSGNKRDETPKYLFFNCHFRSLCVN